MSTITYVHARQILDSRATLPSRSTCGWIGGPSGAPRFRRARRRRRTRRSSCVTAASRFAGKGVTARGRECQRRDRDAVRGRDAADQASSTMPDRARRDRRQIAPRRERDAGVSLAAARAAAERPASRSGATSGGERRSLMPDADDERPERRRARRQPGRLPGVHDRAVGRRTRSPRRCAWAPRPTRAQAHTASPRARHRRWRRGRLRAGARNERGAARAARRGDRSRGYRPGEDIAIALDPASSEFFTEGATSCPEKAASSSSEMVDYWERCSAATPIVRSKTGMAEDDWNGWRTLTDRLGGQLQLVGDDIFVTNPAILRRGIERWFANSILIKLNQIGTLTETLETIALARDGGYRCGHLSPIGRDRGHVHRGPRCRHRRRSDQDRRSRALERVAKYNQLLRIEEELGERARFAGRDAVAG